MVGTIDLSRLHSNVGIWIKNCGLVHNLVLKYTHWIGVISYNCEPFSERPYLLAACDDHLKDLLSAKAPTEYSETEPSIQNLVGRLVQDAMRVSVSNSAHVLTESDRSVQIPRCSFLRGRARRRRSRVDAFLNHTAASCL